MSLDRLSRAVRALVLAVALALAAGQASAQTGTPPPQEPAPAGEEAAKEADPEALRTLLDTLEDDAARETFIRNLRALLEAQEAVEPPAEEPGVGAGALSALSEQLDRLSEGLVEAAAIVVDMPQWLGDVRAALVDPARRDYWIAVLWHVGAVIGAGLLAEWLARLILRRPHRAIEDKGGESLLVRLLLLGARTLLDIVPIAAFAAVAYAVLPLMEPDRTVRLVIVTLIYANVAARAIMAVFRMLLTPHATALRLFAIPDESAAYLYVWAWRATSVSVYGYFAAEAALLLGLDPAAHTVLIDTLGLFVTLLVVVFILQVRRPVGAWIRGAGGNGLGLSTLRARLGDIWHVLAVVYAIAVFVVWVIELEGGFAYLMRATLLTLVTLAVATLAMRAVRRGAARLFKVSRELAERFPGLQERANRYLPLLQRATGIVIGVFAVLALLQIWGIGIVSWFATDSGRGALGSLVTIVAVLIGSLVLWELMSSAIERYLTRVEAADGGGQRLHTLLPLARKAVLIAMVVFVALIVLSELGIDIAPLLAGAGVVGLAIGFGAQTLVKDIITGLFILVQDTIAVGDVVTVAGHTGVVESLSIRSLTLRDLSGTAQTIPFSEVTTVQNMSKGYSYALIDAGVAYREDTDEVAAEMIAVAEELAQDETFAPNIIGPPEMMGVNELGDSAVVVRLRMMVRPGTQWGIRREFYRRMKKRFDEKGIEIPYPHMTLYMGADKAGEAPPVNVRQVRDRAAATEQPKERSAASEADPDLPPSDGEGE